MSEIEDRVSRADKTYLRIVLGWSWEGIEPRAWTLNGFALAKGLIRGLTAALTTLI